MIPDAALKCQAHSKSLGDCWKTDVLLAVLAAACRGKSLGHGVLNFNLAIDKSQVCVIRVINLQSYSHQYKQMEMPSMVKFTKIRMQKRARIDACSSLSQEEDYKARRKTTRQE